jgi:thiamine pyrophosphokinase
MQNVKRAGEMTEILTALTFDSPVVLVGGVPDPVGLSALPSGWQVIAADSGVHAALKAGREPLAIIGDMDSVGDLASLSPDIQQIKLSGQDDTDFEKCLNLITAPLIVGIGFIGSRFDHSLGAMHALAATSNQSQLLLVGAEDIILAVRGDIALRLSVGTRLSIVPLAKQSFVSSRGLAWPLDGLHMQFGQAIGISNHVSASDITITAGAGDGYAVIVPFDCLETIIDQLTWA